MNARIVYEPFRNVNEEFRTYRKKYRPPPALRLDLFGTAMPGSLLEPEGPAQLRRSRAARGIS